MPKKQLRPAPKALDVAKKELRALEGIQKVFNTMAANHIVITDLFITEPLRNMINIEEDLRKLIDGSKTRSDKAIESDLMEIHSKIRNQFNDDSRLRMESFFEFMDPAVARTKEWKQMYQVYLKYSSIDSPEVTKWNRDKLKLDERFSKLTEKVPMEELKMINQSIRTSREKITRLTLELQSEEVSENDEKREQLKREKQHLDNLMECGPELSDIGKEVKNLLNTRPDGAIIDDIMNTAAHLYSQSGTRQDGRANSKEFDEMIMALELVANWDSPETLKTLMQAGDTYRSIDTMLKVLKLTAQTYLDAKHGQIRLIPSAKRQARLALAESLIEFADERLERLNARDKNTVDVEAYKVFINQPEVETPDGSEMEANIEESFMLLNGGEDSLNISQMNVPDL